MGLDRNHRPAADSNLITGLMLGALLTVGFYVFLAIAGWAWRLL